MNRKQFVASSLLAGFGGLALLGASSDPPSRLFRADGTAFPPSLESALASGIGAGSHGTVAGDNDECADAQPLGVPSTTTGTTEGANIDGSFPFCGTSITAAGVWYAVTGTGNTMTATTCGDFFDYDTKISVFCRECDDPLCIAGNDDSCAGGASGLLSTVTWCSQAGSSYFILLHGFGGAEGAFILDIFDDGTPCSGAIECTPPVEDPCPQDTNGDGLVNVLDLVAVILDWGTDGSGNNGDIDGSGTVDVGDLVLVILRWGPCPGKIIPPGQDCWMTSPGTSYDFDATPIPADFFFPGSDPFTGVVTLEGVPSGPQGSDTVVARLDSLFFDAILPSSDTVPIELIQLDLVSTGPITVTFNGGQNPTEWDVEVGSIPASQLGSMTATKTFPDGGTFNSVLPVHPIFTFVESSGPGNIGPVDFGVEFDLVATNANFLQGVPVPGLQCDPAFAPGWQMGPDGEPRCEETCHPSGQPNKEHCVQPCAIPRECPPGSNYGQRPHQPDEDGWIFGTSDKRPNFIRYDDFPHAGTPIETIWFWGADLQFVDPPGAFVECNLTAPSFNVRFYPDIGGMPDKDTPVCTYNVPARQKNRKANYEAAGLTIKGFQYKVNFDPPCFLPPGKWWLSIQGAGGGPDDPADCWFLWLSSPDSNIPGSIFEDDMGNQEIVDYDLSFCINRDGGPNPFGCDASKGECCLPNGSPGCDSEPCCRRVCQIDPFCCNQEWDQLCADGAAGFPQCGCGNLRIIPPGFDCFSTPCGSSEFQLNLPPDFFGPGCQPFNGTVQLGGQSGFVDTQVARLSDLVFDDGQPLPQTSQCDIQLVELSLVGCQPIVVDCPGGPQLWQVEVSVQPGNPPQNIGQMVVTKEHPSGGTYDATLPVFPRFTFIRLDGPGFIPDVLLGEVILNSQGTPWLQGPGIPTFTCDPLFGPGIGLDGDGNPCCQESCHENPGGDHLHCTVPPKCQLPACPVLTCCDGTETPEGEACGDATNNGCNSTPPVFEPITCGQAICGTAWADGGTRDTDWYLVSVLVDTEITAVLSSDFPGVVAVFDVNACPATFQGVFGTSNGCTPLTTAVACVPPGDYAVFVATGNPDGSGIFDGFPCGTQNEYRLEVTCIVPCPIDPGPPPSRQRPLDVGSSRSQK